MPVSVKSQAEHCKFIMVYTLNVRGRGYRRRLFVTPLSPTWIKLQVGSASGNFEIHVFINWGAYLALATRAARCRGRGRGSGGSSRIVGTEGGAGEDKDSVGQPEGGVTPGP